MSMTGSKQFAAFDIEDSASYSRSPGSKYSSSQVSVSYSFS